MRNESNWATSSMKEFVFWRNGMTPEKYDTEREYYYKHMEDVQNETYTPLWKQNNLNDPLKMVYRSTI